MKKLIRISSVLSLMFVFASISANAQSTYGSEVEVPFDFAIADRSYEPGLYVVKITKMSSGGATLSIYNPRADRNQVVLANINGKSASKEMDLVFDVVDGKRTLSRVATPTGSYALAGSPAKRELAARIKTERSGSAVLGGSGSLF